MKNVLVPRKYKKVDKRDNTCCTREIVKNLAGILIPPNPIFQVHHTVTHIHCVFAQTLHRNLTLLIAFF